MFIRVLSSAFIVLSVLATTHDLIKPYGIIQKRGNFVFTDGSSFYFFDKNKNFESGPLGLSGRTISGKWKLKNENTFVIEGRWSWMNGVSAVDDFRTMTISISSPCIYSELKKGQMISLSLQKRPDIHSCYFTIDELIKISSKPK